MAPRIWLLTALALLSTVSVGLLSAKDEAPPGDDKAAAAADESTGEAKETKKTGKASKSAKASKDAPKSRLPNFYGKLDLNDEQKSKIQAIRARYHDDVEKLEKQLDALRKKERGDLAKVLTAEQREKLDELVEHAKDHAGHDHEHEHDHDEAMEDDHDDKKKSTKSKAKKSKTE